MEKIVVGTNNKHKLQEFKDLLKDYEILSLNDIGFPEDIKEDGTTFEENALIKVKTIHNFLNEKKLNYIVMGEDSGLCVDSLNGEPGIYSARYAGNHDDQANRDKLLRELEGKDRTAYFISTIAVYYPDDKYEFFVGKTYGKITTEEIGKTDFGYDPIFYSDDLKKTFGEATEEEKNSVSHRGRALRKMLQKLTEEV